MEESVFLRVGTSYPRPDRHRERASHNDSPTLAIAASLSLARACSPRRYDFPGSTSTIDLHALTGWVPEEHRLQDDAEFNAERTWQRMLSAHRFGDCLITISSKAMSKAEEERSGLVRTHAYAVLDVRFECGLRMLQLKNPWAHKRWKGKFSAHDTASWSPALARALRYDQSEAQRVDDGQFWLDWSTACAMFETLHLNWNPDHPGATS